MACRPAETVYLNKYAGSRRAIVLDMSLSYTTPPDSHRRGSTLRISVRKAMKVGRLHVSISQQQVVRHRRLQVSTSQQQVVQHREPKGLSIWQLMQRRLLKATRVWSPVVQCRMLQISISKQ